MRKPFKTNHMEGDEIVMFITEPIDEIRFNIKSREINIVYKDSDKYTVEDLDALSWQTLKAMVLDANGVWSSKVNAIDFLTGKPKQGE